MGPLQVCGVCCSFSFYNSCIPLTRTLFSMLRIVRKNIDAECVLAEVIRKRHVPDRNERIMHISTQNSFISKGFNRAFISPNVEILVQTKYLVSR